MEFAYIKYFLHFFLRILFLKKPFVYKSKRLVYYDVPKDDVFFQDLYNIRDYFLKKYPFIFTPKNPCESVFYGFLDSYIFPFVPFVFVENFFYYLIHCYYFFKALLLYVLKCFLFK